MLPLKSVDLKGQLNGSIASIDLQLTYQNESHESAMECAFDFPITANSIVSKLVACIGDRVVECSIRDKEEAKQRYEDAIAGGHAAVLGDKKKDAVSIKIGNLLPG